MPRRSLNSPKPNILVIWGDDIGQTNISAYTMGMVGYRTPNIDRIAKEGIIFTDYYAEQSCTAGRSSFITGQSVFRTGLSKVGLPGSDLGLQAEDATIAELLKPLGYATGQFGKNHLGDRDEFLPSNHGFDEFFGNLYHLNAEEEPELPDYPKDPEFRKKFGPRGVIHSYADGRIEDTGPLTKKRMETVDEETLAGALRFIESAHKAGKPFFVWWNGTRMHFRTHVKKENRGISGQNEYGDGMVEHDGHVGQLLKKLDDLGIADNTIVFYSTDNGPHMNTWPEFRKKFGPRGVIHSYADGRIEDTGPLTKKRMETVDEETLAGALRFIESAHKAGKPFFVWWNGTRMHFRTHVKKENRGISGQNEYGDGMVEHDGHVGQLLKKLDDLGIADNTIVFYSTDNGPHMNTWPDAASTPFRGEKNTNWEGGWRVPAMVRWPGKIKPGSVSNEIMHHMDWSPSPV